MPYLLISTQIRLETGPTLCGDEWSDTDIMKYLGAELQPDSAKCFKVYKCPDAPRVVLNKLADIGYHVVASAGVGQTCIWTLYKPDNTQSAT